MNAQDLRDMIDDVKIRLEVRSGKVPTALYVGEDEAKLMVKLFVEIARIPISSVRGLKYDGMYVYEVKTKTHLAVV